MAKKKALPKGGATGKKVEGDPAQTGKEDLQKALQRIEGLQGELEEIKLKAEQDVDNVRSSLMVAAEKRQSEMQKQLKIAQEQIFSLQTKDLDGADLAKFESSHYQEQLNDLRTANEQLQETLVRIQNAQQFAQSAVSAFGINPQDIDWSEPDATIKTTWDAAAVRLQASEAELKEAREKLQQEPTAPGDDKPPAKTQPEAPSVVTTTDTAPVVESFDATVDTVAKQVGFDHLKGGEKMDMFWQVLADPNRYKVDVDNVISAIEAEQLEETE